MYRDIVDRLRNFYAGIGYLLFTAVVCFLGHALNMELIFLPILAFSLGFGFLICRDVKFAMLPFMCCTFVVGAKGYSPSTGYERFLQNKWYLFVLLATVLFVTCSLAFFIVRNWRCRNQICFTKGFLALTVWCGAMMLNGLFHQGYTWKNAAYAAALAVTSLGIYLIFATFMEYKESVVPYFFTCLGISAFLIVAELLLAFITKIEIGDDSILKESVILGWGVWTDIGGMLAFFLPVGFYFALSSKHGWIGYLLGIFEYFCILLTQSRGALLIGSFVLVLCLFYLCLFGKNRKINRIFTVVVICMGLFAVAFAMPKVIALVKNFLEDGFSDNGRFDLWLIGMKNFFENPVFGSGFYDSYINSEWNTMGISPALYHNTLVQMLGACGMVGFLAYAFHRILTVRMMIKKPNEVKTFLGFCILGLCLCSLIDVLLFKLYPGIFYGFMLLIMEISDISNQRRPVVY